MILDAIAQKALENQFDKAEIEAFCQQENIAATDFMERFARYIVEGYLAGRYTWITCDTAMNCLSGMMFQEGILSPIPEYPWRAFLAFDAGEYHPETPDLIPDEVTRPLINDLIEKFHVA